MKRIICWVVGHDTWKVKSETGLQLPVTLFNLTANGKDIADIRFCTRCFSMYAEPPIIAKKP